MKDIIIMSQYRPDLEEEIISLFLDENMIKDYTDKQKIVFIFIVWNILSLSWIERKMKGC